MLISLPLNPIPAPAPTLAPAPAHAPAPTLAPDLAPAPAPSPAPFPALKTRYWLVVSLLYYSLLSPIILHFHLTFLQGFDKGHT